MADLIKNIKLGNKTYQIKDAEAADTRITEAEIIALIQTNYKADPNPDNTDPHEDEHTSQLEETNS